MREIIVYRSQSIPSARSLCLAWCSRALTSLTLSIALMCGLMSVGCDDPPPPPARVLPDQALAPDMEPATPQDVGISDDLDPPDLTAPPLDMDPPPPPPPGWLEITLSPARTFYRLDETPTLSVAAFDVYGDPIVDGRYRYQLSSPIARLRSGESEVELGATSEVAEVTLELIDEGALEVEVCALDLNQLDAPPEVCAVRPLIVDQSAPKIEVFWPRRGSALSAGDAWPTWGDVTADVLPPDELFEGALTQTPELLTEWIPVYGQVQEEGGQVSLALNGAPISVDAEGRFSGLVPARPGYVEISLIGDDSVRTTQSVNRRWVLYALDYLSLEPEGNKIDDGILLGLNQLLIDDDTPLEGARPLDVREASQLVQLILAELDPSSLIAQGDLINSSELSLSLEDVTLGEPEIDLSVTAEGLSLFVALENVVVTVSGRLELGSTVIDLNGDLAIRLGAFADYQLSSGDTSAVQLTYLDGAVALNELTPRLNSDAANALLEVLESTARQLVVEQLESQLLDALTDELPLLLEAAIDDIFDQLRSVDVRLDSGLEGAPVLDLEFSVSPQSVEMIPQTSALLSAEWSSTRVATSRADLEVEVRGVPALYERRDPLWFDDGFSVMLHTEVVNSILTEITRGGLLSLAPEIPASAQFFYTAAQLSSETPPVFVLGDESERYPFYLELGALSLELTQSQSGAADHYEVFIRVGGEVLTDEGTFFVSLSDTPKVVVTLSELNNDRPAVDEIVIENLLLQQVWPLISEGFTSQLVFGFPDSVLPLDQLSSLGVELGQSTLRVRLAESAEYALGWIYLGGYISILVE